MAQLNESFLRNYGGSSVNDFRNVINDATESDNGSVAIINASNYHDTEDIIEKLSDKSKYFKIISFNAESLPVKLTKSKFLLI